MTVKDVQDILGARVLTGEEFLDREVRSACGSDMMSDVLAFSKDHSVLLTGLCNPQVIRTAEMLDIVAWYLSGGKSRMKPLWRWQRSGRLLCWRPGTGCFPPAGCFTRPGGAEVRSDG